MKKAPVASEEEDTSGDSSADEPPIKLKKGAKDESSADESSQKSASLKRSLGPSEKGESSKKAKVEENGGKKSKKKKAKAAAEAEKEEGDENGRAQLVKVKAEPVENVENVEVSAKKKRKPKDENGSKQDKQQRWTPRDELVLAYQMKEDLDNGVDIRHKTKTDAYWDKLANALRGKLDSEFTKEQIFQKYKRSKEKLDKQPLKKRGNEDELQGLLKHIWGHNDGNTTPMKSVSRQYHDEEESDGDMATYADMGTSEPGSGTGKRRRTGKKQENGFSLQEEQVKSELGVLKRNEQQVDAVLSIGTSLCAGLPGFMEGYKIGLDAGSGKHRNLRRRILEEKLSEYAAMKRRLQLVSDLCSVEEERLKKELEKL